MSLKEYLKKDLGLFPEGEETVSPEDIRQANRETDQLYRNRVSADMGKVANEWGFVSPRDEHQVRHQAREAAKETMNQLQQ